MEAKYLVLGREATPEEIKVIEECQEKLKAVKLDLIGTRPNDR